MNHGKVYFATFVADFIELSLLQFFFLFLVLEVCKSNFK